MDNNALTMNISDLIDLSNLNLEAPELIDLSNIDLRNLGKPVKEITEIPQNKLTHMNEYIDEVNILIIKSTILNHISTMSEISDGTDKTIVHQMYNILKNLLILHGKSISNLSQFIREIEDNMNLLELSFNRFVIHKILNNIKHGKYYDNIHFREINIDTSNIPPMTVEERINIEEKLPQFIHSKQIKKKQKPFNVGEIVGAKDKETKWWLARVLHRHDAPDCADYWYYIRFENCDSIHDEWISSKSFRVRYFNPKRHFLKRRSIAVK